jgi:hypothetical protein
VTTADALGPSRIETWSACNAKVKVSRISAKKRRTTSKGNPMPNKGSQVSRTSWLNRNRFRFANSHTTNGPSGS